MSSPIFDPENDEDIIGVLLMIVRVDGGNGLLQWFAYYVKMEHGFAVLVDGRGHCVYHKNERGIMPLGPAVAGYHVRSQKLALSRPT